jgi:hypothetical protein
VQAFSGDGTIGLAGGRVQVSNTGGAQPLWRRDGRELYYHTLPEGKGTLEKVMAVAVQLSPRLQIGRPRELFSIDFREALLHTKDVWDDGKRFLMVLSSRESPLPARLTLVTDWQAKLGK